MAHSKAGIFVLKHKYVVDLLKETGILRCKLVDTPIEPNHKLSQMDKDATINRGRYQRLVGKLIYLSHARPNIAYTIV